MKGVTSLLPRRVGLFGGERLACVVPSMVRCSRRLQNEKRQERRDDVHDHRNRSIEVGELAGASLLEPHIGKVLAYVLAR